MVHVHCNDTLVLYILLTCRVARIKQLLGRLDEAVTDYTAVLNLGPYVPAFKGMCCIQCYFTFIDFVFVCVCVLVSVAVLMEVGRSPYIPGVHELPKGMNNLSSPCEISVIVFQSQT